MNNSQSIFWRIFRVYAIVILLALGVAAVFLRFIITSFVTNQEENRLKLFNNYTHEHIMSHATDDLSGSLDSDIDDLLHSDQNEYQRAIISKDSFEMISASSNFNANMLGVVNVELKRARANGSNEFIGSGTVSSDFVFVASTITLNGSECFLVSSIPYKYINSKINALFLQSMAGFFFALICGAIVAYMLALNFARPLELMQRSARRFGSGDFSRKVPSPPNFELNTLADALNKMALQMEERIGEITQQRNEQMAILESLTEGVLAIDQNERILSINNIGSRLLEVNAHEVQGRLVQEFLRQIDLQRFIQSSLEGNYTQDDEYPQQIRLSGDRLLEVRSAPLRNQDGEDIGTIIIMVDITRIDQLENLRRDFVANVSHELRTPITSIKGFTETLLDGALEDDPEQAKKFLEVIDRQSTRLGQVIEDLLKLSRLDRKEELIREPILLEQLLNHTMELCQPEAELSSTEIVCECKSPVSVPLNETLMEQALTNLVSNAIRYAGGEGKKVWLRGEVVGNKLKFEIADEGPGISKEHLPRLFERFYRIDKARSRDIGGTGLGLSIVKHVVVAHHGTIDVESEINQGTTFKIEIPAA